MCLKCVTNDLLENWVLDTSAGLQYILVSMVSRILAAKHTGECNNILFIYFLKGIMKIYALIVSPLPLSP